MVPALDSVGGGKNVLEIRCDFKASFLSKKVPKVSKMSSQMGSKMAPKLTKREAFLENCSGGGPGVSFGSILGCFGEHFGWFLGAFWGDVGVMLE